MAKNKAENPIEGQEVEQTRQPENTAPAAPTAENHTSTPLAELKEKGIVTLTAKTREQLQDDALQLIESAEGKAYADGAAGYDAICSAYKITIKLKE